MEEKLTGFRATGLFLSGFQSIEKDTYIPIGKLTFLYGPNSAGKSAVLDAIGLLQNLANQEIELFFKKVDRWIRRELDEEGRTVRWARGHLRVGVEFTVPKNWKELVTSEYLESIKNDYTVQDASDWIESLVDKKIQLDVGIQDGGGPLTYRLAIDGSPLFECRLGEKDDGRTTFWDRNGRSPNDEGYDEEDEIMVEGPMRIYHNHRFWDKLAIIASLSDFAKWNSEPGIALFVRGDSSYIDLYDVISCYREQKSGENYFPFTVGNEFFQAIRKNHSRHQRNWAMVQKKRLTKVGLTGESTNKQKPNRRLWNSSHIDEVLKCLSAMCRGLLELGARSLANVKVSGSRQILSPGDMTFTAKDFFESASEREPRKFPSFLSFARHLAYEEAKSTLLAYYRFTPHQDHRLVNKWLLATLPSLRGHRLCADAFVTNPVPRKKAVLADVPKFTYRLYLTDAQGRAHEFEDVGSGFSYLLPILLALWDKPWSIVEQPELHLHPAAQCDVADVFIAAKNIGHAAVIESHSENLLLRLLRRIRETNDGSLKDKSLEVVPDDVAVMYFDPQSDGTTVVKRLRISRDGDFIDRWPAGFFEERTKELFGE